MKCIDAHIHIFSSVHGANAYGRVLSEKWGRVKNGGEIKPFIPPLSADTSFSCEQLLAYMDENEIERAVLLQNPTIGDVNEEIAMAVAEWPNRFAGTLQVNPFSAVAVDEMEQLLASGTFRALKLELSDDWGWLSIYNEREFFFSILYPLMEVAEEHSLNVIIDPGNTKGKAYRPDDYLSVVRKFPQVRFLIEHLGYWTPDGDRAAYDRMISVGKCDNVCFGLSATATLLQDPYPCTETLRHIEHVWKKLGTDKLLWGSDAPTTLNGYTYRQLRDFILNARFLGSEELEKIMYKNAKEMFFE